MEQLGENGFVLAEMLTRLLPKINIIFLARDLEYADKAVKFRASGYIVMPLTAEKIHQEMANLRFPVSGLS